MANRRPPNYYAILEISDTASTTQIREAYKRAALKTHPDRVPNDSPERADRTRKFQLVNDAYYTLSDATRRRDYDAQRNLFTPPPSTFSSTSSSSRRTGARQNAADSHAPPPGTFNFDPFADENMGDAPPPNAAAGTAAGNAFSWAWNFFTNSQSQNQNQPDDDDQRRARAEAEEEQFADVFEEMLREEGMAEPGTGRPTGKFWSLMGGISGGALGFIVANVPGLVAGAVAGNRLGAVRDAKGKSVYAVFQELPQNDRARLLTQLATKVFSHAVGI